MKLLALTLSVFGLLASVSLAQDVLVENDEQEIKVDERPVNERLQELKNKHAAEYAERLKEIDTYTQNEKNTLQKYMHDIKVKAKQASDKEQIPDLDEMLQDANSVEYDSFLLDEEPVTPVDEKPALNE